MGNRRTAVNIALDETKNLLKVDELIEAPVWVG